MGVWADIKELRKEILNLKRRTSTAGGGVPAAAHASTHSDGGSDEVDVTDLAGYPGGSPKTYLDSDGEFTDPSSSSPHASDHYDGGSDEIDVTQLGGFPGGSPVTYLDSDGNFSEPPGTGGGGSPGGGSAGDLLDFQFVRKTADETVTSSAVLQADDHLLFPIGANETWEFQFVIVHLGSETGDFKVSVSGPTGCAGQWMPFGPASPTATGSRTFQSGGFITWDQSESFPFGNIGSSSRTTSVIYGLARNGANAGNVALNWAQNASNPTGTTVKADSYVIARRVA